MTQTMVRLAPRELALWLGLPLEVVQEKVRVRTEEGRWRVIPDDHSPGAERVELPAADLNAELDAQHGEAPIMVRPDPTVSKLEADLAQARLRNEELNRLLVQASHAIEATRARAPVTAPAPEPQPEPEPPKAKPVTARSDDLTDELIETKRSLIAAYDKILHLQEQVFGAQEHMASAKEDTAAVDAIHSILERLKGRRTV